MPKPKVVKIESIKLNQAIVSIETAMYDKLLQKICDMDKRMTDKLQLVKDTQLKGAVLYNLKKSACLLDAHVHSLEDLINMIQKSSETNPENNDYPYWDVMDGFEEKKTYLRKTKKNMIVTPEQSSDSD